VPAKVVLTSDPRVVPGVPCLVRVVAVHEPERDDRGRIEVELVGRAPFRLEGVYLDPTVSKKLQVLLEGGLNILLDGPQGCGEPEYTGRARPAVPPVMLHCRSVARRRFWGTARSAALHRWPRPGAR
jgi:hypothetical protein